MVRRRRRAGTRVLAESHLPSALPSADPAWPEFVCPRCRTPVERDSAAWRCHRCRSVFPELYGIADFRLEPDPWIGIEEDREKARRLIESTPDATFDDTVRAYWDMTASTPRAQALRFIEAVQAAEQRTIEWLALPEHFALQDARSAHPVLDLGCGTGELLAVLATRGVPAIGIDVAMRWLVQARRRGPLRDGRQLLVCCNAEFLPFAAGTVGAVTSLGMLEHCRAAGAVLRDAHRVLRAGGSLHMRTVNRFGVLPEPHVGVWGVGFVPRRYADAYVRWANGQRYLHHRPVSAPELRRALAGAGFSDGRVTAAALLSSDMQRLPRSVQSLGAVYARLRRLPAVGRMMSLLAPLLDAYAHV